MRLLLLTILSFGISSLADDGGSIRQWQVGAGPAIVDSVNTPYVITSWRFGYLYQPMPSFDIQAIFDWGFSSNNTDMHFFRFAAAGDYFFSDADDAPFATLDLGYGSVHAHRPCEDATCQSSDDDAGAFSAGLGAGYKFRRNSSVSFGVLAHYGAVFARTRYGTPDKLALMGLVYF